MTAELQGRKSLCTVASLTPKADEQRNEDAATVLGDGESTFHGVAVADGLGSFSHGGDAARFVIQQVEVLAKTLDLSSAAGLRELFPRIRRDLREYVRNFPEVGTMPPESYGTTLIVAVETPTQLVAAYTGNGSIWHLRGNFDDSVTTSGIPWSSVNYLRPHSVLVDGRERLDNLMALTEQFDRPPTVITVDKDPDFGDILCICTDGISSADQLGLGTDAQGGLWFSAEASMISFYAHLRSYFSSPREDAGLQAFWQGYLLELKSRHLLEDDATLGLILTGDALAWQGRRHSKTSA